RRAGTLILGVASMLIVAGTIEGFISPQRWAPQARIAIGTATAALLVLYFGLCGERGDA
ncbi:MAG: stage II sporulation protein M, partial [Candidatus Eremiobacteraeota bacterium]|nr:stage II sporulation protein M [Candidatus Eremiobacteraeota bacterium]